MNIEYIFLLWRLRQRIEVYCSQMTDFIYSFMLIILEQVEVNMYGLMVKDSIEISYVKISCVIKRNCYSNSPPLQLLKISPVSSTKEEVSNY